MIHPPKSVKSKAEEGVKCSTESAFGTNKPESGFEDGVFRESCSRNSPVTRSLCALSPIPGGVKPPGIAGIDSDILVVLIEDHAIEAGHRVLGQHGE